MHMLILIFYKYNTAKTSHIYYRYGKLALYDLQRWAFSFINLMRIDVFSYFANDVFCHTLQRYH